MLKVCFICTGNTCRSIMAERIMKLKLKKMGIKDIKVSSKGLKATGENITNNAKLVLKSLGALSSDRKSIKFTKPDSASMYVVMNENQKVKINSKRVFSFEALIGQEILDPYGQNYESYFETAKLLEKGVLVLIDKIGKMRGDR